MCQDENEGATWQNQKDSRKVEVVAESLFFDSG